MRATFFFIWRSTRSLLLPKTLVRMDMNNPDGVEKTRPARVQGNRSCYYTRGGCRLLWRRRRPDSRRRARPVPVHYATRDSPGFLAVAAHVGQRIDHPALVPDLVMDMRPGRAPG